MGEGGGREGGGERGEKVVTHPLEEVEYICSRPKTVFIKDGSSSVSTIPSLPLPLLEPCTSE